MRTDKGLASAPAVDEPANPPAIVVKTDSVGVLRNAAGWSMAELSRHARLDQSAVARLLRGDLRPGPRSIAGLLLAFSGRFPHIGFYELFELRELDGSLVEPVPLEDEDDDDTPEAAAV